MELTLEELSREVADRLRSAGVSQGNGQVSALPEGRTLRYYTTIGLLDRPLAMRGRQAVYGQRHVLQAVAVKRLQAAGLSLAEIQTRLSGLPDVELASLFVTELQTQRVGAPSAPAPRGSRAPAATAAGMVGEGPTGAADVVPAGIVDTAGHGTARGRRGGRWWADGRGAGGGAVVPPIVPAGTPDEVPVTLTAVALGSAITLLVPTGQPLSADEVDSIRRAAAPLLAHLASAGHTGARSDQRTAHDHLAPSHD